MRVTSIATIQITLQNQEFELDVFVASDLGRPFILGLTWLREERAVVDLYQDVVHLGKRFRCTVPLIPPQGSTPKLNNYIELENGFPKECQKEVRAMLESHSHILTPTPGRLTRTTSIRHEIRLTNPTPFRLPPYRYSDEKKLEIDQQVKGMLDQGIIETCVSPYSSPIVLAKKKDGTWRFCIDYRRLNRLTEDSAQPIPRISDTLKELGDSKVFSTLDLKSGYWQVPLAQRSKPLTAFSTPSGGTYQFNVMPFGLKGAPGTFQRLMAQEVLTGYLGKFCICYLDDIIIHSKTFKETRDKLLRWALLLQEFQFTIEHCAGKDNELPDLLSRNPLGLHDELEDIDRMMPPESAPSSVSPTKPQILMVELAEPLIDEIIRHQQHDEKLAQLATHSLQGNSGPYQLEEGALWYEDPQTKSKRLTVPLSSRKRVLFEFHDQIGHPGEDETIRSIASRFHWPGQSNSVREHVKLCHICACGKKAKTSPTDMRPHQPTEPWKTIAVDFMDQTPTTPGSDPIPATPSSDPIPTTAPSDPTPIQSDSDQVLTTSSSDAHPTATPEKEGREKEDDGSAERQHRYNLRRRKYYCILENIKIATHAVSEACLKKAGEEEKEENKENNMPEDELTVSGDGTWSKPTPVTPTDKTTDLTGKVMKQMSINYSLAIQRYPDSLAEMKREVWAGFYHMISTDAEPQHTYCNSDWCKYLKAQDGNVVFKHKPALSAEVQELVKPVFEQLIDEKLLRRCLGKNTQNNNECYNKTLWALVPKSTFVGLSVTEIAVQISLATFNEGRITLLKMMEIMGCTIGRYAYDYALRKDDERIAIAEKATKAATKEGRIKHKERQKDEQMEYERSGLLLYGAGIAD
ncbi:hypothetical protein TKK_0015558 [Trichogramma kaykai]